MEPESRSAPSETAAAEYYPHVLVLMITNLDKGEFPAHGHGIRDTMKAQHYWVDSVKNSASHATRSAKGHAHGAQDVPEGSSLRSGVGGARRPGAMTN